MGFNKKILPAIEILEMDLQQLGNSRFFSKWLKKVDSFTGPVESVEFIKTFMKQQSLHD